MEQSTLKKLEYNKIQDRLISLAYSETGKTLAENWHPVSDFAQIDAWLDENEEAMELLRFGEPSFLSQVTDVSSILSKTRVAGVLNPFELLQIYYLLRASRLAVQYTSSRCQKLKQLCSGLSVQSALEKKIIDIIDEEGEIRSDASPALKSIRTQIEVSRQRIKDYLQNFIRSGDNQSRLQDAIVTERAGRYVVPVKQEYRNEVKGIVHDESASGATVFIEPLPVVEHNNRIRSLQNEEKREIERLLREVSLSISVYTDELRQNVKILTEFDLVFARAHLAYNMNAYRPIMNKHGIIQMQRARHPLLGDRAVPVNVELGQKFDILVITGPNTGGKTVVLKTIGLLTLMAMSGLFIPAREKSKVAVFEKIFVDIGDEQSIEQSLSTFSSHMSNIIKILTEVDAKSLVLLDELGAGTDPYEGAALARSILEEMHKKQVRAVVTTHQSELKTYAFQSERVENACVEFNPVTLKPTYELSIGTPGQSNAFEIASRLGLNSSVVDRARELVPQREAEIGNMIRQLKESRYYYEQNQQELEISQRRLAEEKALLEKERDQFERQRDEVLQKARLEADQYLRQLKREANEAVDELKDLLKQKEHPPKWHEVEQKRRRLKELHPDLPDDMQPEKGSDLPIRPGDYVLIRDIHQKGHVISGPNAQGEIVVQAGIMKLTVKQDQCVITASEDERKTKLRNQVFLDKARSISPELDLRGQLSADALMELDKYLDDANLVGLEQVRIIHGKGTGALRKAVREYLRTHRYVEEYRDGFREEGGYGVTVVKLK